MPNLDGTTIIAEGNLYGSQPLLAQHVRIIQEFGTLRLLPHALSHDARLLSASCSTRF